MGLRLVGTVIRSPEGARYKVGKKLGEGGFGTVFETKRVDDGGPEPPQALCLKMTENIDGWIREAYYGRVFSGDPRIIRVEEFFPLRRRGRPRYVLIMERAEEGDLQTHLKSQRKPWPEARIRREVAALLSSLERLHTIKGVHRDLTPMNVLVCRRGVLKLGDFGIAQVSDSPVPATTLNPNFAPGSVLAGNNAKWHTEDDVWQVGQLIAMLVRGEARLLKAHELRTLPCSAELKQIIRRAVASKPARYRDAFQLKEALIPSKEPPIRGPALTTLKGKTVVITGTLWTSRSSAIAMIMRCGGRMSSEVSPATDVLVQGKASGSYVAGVKGIKRLEAEGINAKGGRISIIGEKRFRDLVRKRA